MKTYTGTRGSAPKGMNDPRSTGSQPPVRPPVNTNPSRGAR